MMGILIILAFMAGTLVAWLIVHVMASRHGTTSREELSGLLEAATERTQRKEANKAKALELLEQKGELSNEDLRQALNVSRSSVVRYMDELEKAGKVEQVGDAGRNVTYHLRP